MQRLPVESSDVLSIGYDAAERILEVEFHGGRVYRYRGVEPDMHAQFMKADSYGQFLFAYINGHYRYEKVTDEAPDAVASAQPIVFVTGNAHKMRELQKACAKYDIAIEQLELPVDEIQSDDPQEIAIKKAKHAYAIAKRPVIANDSYWNILALRGFPGAYMSSVTRWLRPEDFLRLMADKTDRTIVLTDTIVYYDGKRPKVFTKDYMGEITQEPAGEGAAIDQIVVMRGRAKTVAQLFAEGERGGLNPDDDIFYDMAKWLRLQRRLGKL